MYKIEFTDDALKQLKKLERNIQARILATLERIRVRPEHFLTKLVSDPAYKLRIWDYRLLVDMDKERLMVLVIRIGYRKNVYER